MKTYNIMLNIGHAKYVVNYHDGIKKHKDQGNFYDIKIFKNKKKMEAFIRELGSNGYSYGHAWSITLHVSIIIS